MHRHESTRTEPGANRVGAHARRRAIAIIIATLP